MTMTKTLMTAALLALALGAQAQTKVENAWVRGTVAQQKATGLFARVTSPAGGRIVAVSSPLAGVAELHEMALEGDVMRMRMLPNGIPLPAGQAVELKPGGLHVMLMDLKRPLADGDVVPVTLVVEGAGGKRETVEVKAPVRPLGR
jgi:periplasmic copper chaperone A